MNFRHRYLLVPIRTLFGLFMLMSGVTGFLAASNGMEGVPPPMVAMTQALWDMGIFQMIKTTEIVAGLMLIVGFRPQLAVVALTPLAVGIVIVNARIAPDFLPTAAVVWLFLGYLIYAHWPHYRTLFANSVIERSPATESRQVPAVAAA